jgi:hypothetical protein
MSFVNRCVRLLIPLTFACATMSGQWVSLFDGKTLKGWEVHSGTATYAAEDGAIVGTAVLGSPNTFLCTTKQFGDFVLEFEVKVDPELNSGVQFRSQIGGPDTRVKIMRGDKEEERAVALDRVYGYQVEIARGPGNSGNIYDEARRAVMLDNFKSKPEALNAFKNNEWNKFRVECRGDWIRTWVNGVACADFHDSMTLRGIFGLQVHAVPKQSFKPYQARWRNIRIQELR